MAILHNFFFAGVLSVCIALAVLMEILCCEASIVRFEHNKQMARSLRIGLHAMLHQCRL